MFAKDSILDAHNIRGNSIHRKIEATKSPVRDNEVPVSHGRSRFVLQSWTYALDQIEETLTARHDVSAELEVPRRPNFPAAA